MNSKFILEVKDITKRYGNKVVLNNVSFKLEKGKVLGLLGANGAGKTTLTETIVGITQPSSGEILYNYDFYETPKEGLGMQFQDSTYPSGLTVKDIISFARNIHKIKITQKELRDILNTFQMGSFYNEKVKSLSGGQRQKLNILLSMLHEPKIVMLDELTTGLDIATREDVIKFTKDLIKSRGISVIIISHHMHEIEALADEVIVLSKGNLVKEDSIKNIKKQYGSLDKYMVDIINNENTNINISELSETLEILNIGKRISSVFNKFKWKGRK